jgi:hypothetical protein
MVLPDCTAGRSLRKGSSFPGRIADGWTILCQPIHFVAEVAAVISRLDPDGALENLNLLLDIDCSFFRKGLKDMLWTPNKSRAEGQILLPDGNTAS